MLENYRKSKKESGITFNKDNYTFLYEMTRRNVPEGAEKPYAEGDNYTSVHGGKTVDYFWKYPNASGVWPSKE